MSEDEAANGAGGNDDDDVVENGGFAASTRRGPPASLSLLEGMFFSHELGPVNPKAQGMVAPPEGLDLDAPLSSGAWLAAAGAPADEA